MGARTPISEVNDILHLKLPVEEAHTIGGFLTNRLRRIPREGDFVEEQGYRISAVEADARSVLKVRVERL
jgi:CBS domain containing-hemolysin-like protein